MVQIPKNVNIHYKDSISILNKIIQSYEITKLQEKTCCKINLTIYYYNNYITKTQTCFSKHISVKVF